MKSIDKTANVLCAQLLETMDALRAGTITVEEAKKKTKEAGKLLAEAGKALKRGDGSAAAYFEDSKRKRKARRK